MGSSEQRLSGIPPASYGRADLRPREGGPANLADILERVLDKGVVIAGDITIQLLDIELLTLKLRLLIASADTARSMGIDWWEHDPALTSGARDVLEENRRLRQRIGELQSGRADADGGAIEAGDDREEAEPRPEEPRRRSSRPERRRDTSS